MCTSDSCRGYCDCGRTAMQRIVDPPYAGSNPVSHLFSFYAKLRKTACCPSAGIRLMDSTLLFVNDHMSACFSQDSCLFDQSPLPASCQALLPASGQSPLPVSGQALLSALDQSFPPASCQAFRQLINQAFTFVPSQAGVGDRLAVAASVDRLVAVLDVALDHEALDHAL